MWVLVAVILVGCVDGVTWMGMEQKQKRTDRSVDLIMGNPSFKELFNERAWLIEQGVVGGSMRLVASRNIEKGEVVLTVPKDVLWFVDSSIALFPPLGALKGIADEEYVAALGVALVYQLHEGSLPLAFQVLPHTCVSGFDLFTDVQRAFPPLAFARDYWPNVMDDSEKRIWERLMHLLPVELRVVSYNDFQWGICIIRTRCYLHHFLGPIADLIGHSLDLENTLWDYRNDTGLIYTAKRPILHGEEIWASYSCHSKLTMLFSYGFAAEGENHCNRVHIDADLSLIPMSDSFVKIETAPHHGRPLRATMSSAHSKTPGTFEIDIEAGEEVLFLMRSDNGWAEVSVPRTDERGWVPLHHLQLAQLPLDEQALLLKPLQAGLQAYPPIPANLNPEVRKVLDANKEVIQRAITQLGSHIRKQGDEL